MTSCLALMTFWLTAHGADSETFRCCRTCQHATDLLYKFALMDKVGLAVSWHLGFLLLASHV